MRIQANELQIGDVIKFGSGTGYIITVTHRQDLEHMIYIVGRRSDRDQEGHKYIEYDHDLDIRRPQ